MMSMANLMPIADMFFFDAEDDFDGEDDAAAEDEEYSGDDAV